jgi:hypothetical protein
LVETEFAFHDIASTGAVVLQKAVAVGTIGKRNVEDFRIVQCLLHAGAHRVLVVLGLDHRDRDVGLVEQQVVDLLGFAALHGLAAHDDAALGEVDFLTKLGHHIPLVAARADDGGSDELGADVGLGEFLLVQAIASRFAMHRQSRLGWAGRRDASKWNISSVTVNA